ncbi:hypothetical protein BRN31_22325 [Xanthomonas oryzae pv. oryzae]|nr:hypothetical protein BRN31_22325 [Xanthomonas oryzae pv. oryzae]RBL53382.1 hypothetical protein BRN24_18490 [Xanthomonas oryzae pv. oryzae]
MAAQAFNAIGQTLWFSLALGNFIARLLDSAKFALVSIYLACSGLRLLPLKQGGLKSQVQHLERPAVREPLNNAPQMRDTICSE